MSRGHIVICGHGPGIGHAVAHRFGEGGFTISLIGRNASRLEAAASELESLGVRARAIAADLGEPTAVEGAMARATAVNGSITTLHWNAVYPGAGSLLDASNDELEAVARLGLLGPLAAVRSALADLRGAEAGAVLVTGGGLAGDGGDPLAIQHGMSGVAIAKAMHRKLTRLLALSLEGTNVYAGELAVLGMVRSDSNPHGTVDPKAVAQALFEMQRDRAGIHHQVTGDAA
ncbi:MAG: SDR family NAD(P)-dependent oxidoreductase [Myxococcota bacterium]